MVAFSPQSSSSFEETLARIGTAAPEIVRTAVPCVMFGRTLLDVLYDVDGQPRNGQRWARLLLAACWDASGTTIAPVWACVGFECVMAAADLFDEIQDGDPSPIVERYGSAVASNAAAALLVVGMDLLREAETVHDPSLHPSARTGVRSILAVGLLEAAAGQHLDLTHGPSDQASSEQLERAAGKSATLTRTACKIGAMLGTSDCARVEAIGHVGYLIGMAAQLRNDARAQLQGQRDPRQASASGPAPDIAALTLWALSEKFVREATAAAQSIGARWLNSIVEGSGAGRGSGPGQKPRRPQSALA